MNKKKHSEHEHCVKKEEEEDHSLNIIIYPYTDPVHDSPALNFPVIRQNMVEGKVLKFGRKINKESPEDNCFVAFQSKVVSRNHAEIWYKDGQLYFRDIGSSSGTFLNKLRLSPSGKESRPYPLRSGDVIQLGIDYHGKKEDIYRCIMMKIIIQGKDANIKRKANIERLNNAIKELIAAAAPNTKDEDQLSSVECCICLNTLAPYQALFLAPCTHCFHYKCVHPLLGGGIMFLCPLCRQVANLEATVSTDNLFEMEDDFKAKRQSLSEKSRSKEKPKDRKLSKGNKPDSNNKGSKTNLASNAAPPPTISIISSSPNAPPPNINVINSPSPNTNASNEQSSDAQGVEKTPNSSNTQNVRNIEKQSHSCNPSTVISNEKTEKPTKSNSCILFPEKGSSSSAQNNNGSQITNNSKKKDVSPLFGKKLIRKGTLKSLITTTFRRKRSNSTHISSERLSKTKNKNVKSTGNIFNPESVENSIENLRATSPITNNGSSLASPDNKTIEDDSINIAAAVIDDDPKTANELSALTPEMKNSQVIYPNGMSRESNLQQ